MKFRLTSRNHLQSIVSPDTGIIVDFGQKKKHLKKSTLPRKKSTFLGKKAPILQTKTLLEQKKTLSKHYFINKNQQ